MLPTIVYLLFWQPQFDPGRSMAELQNRARAHAAEVKRDADNLSAAERREFADRYNRLIYALRKFELEYIKGEGNVWPKRSADDLQKALRAFQGTASWKQHERLSRVTAADGQ